MKILFVIPLVLIITALSFSPDKTENEKPIISNAAPNIELLEMSPVDAANNIYYLFCAPRTSNSQQSAQLSVRFKIKNKESKSLTLTGITYIYYVIGKPVVKSMALNYKDLSKKEAVILAGDPFEFQNSRGYHKVDNALLIEGPIPSFVSIRLSFKGYSTPYIITRNIRPYFNEVTGGAYSFSGRESDLGMNEYWYGYGGHGGGSQFFAYDIKAIGWDEKKKEWDEKFPDTDGSKNEHFRAYGKPVISICDGTVVDFTDGIAENEGYNDDGSGGGNWFKINNGKETICYFHMQPGSLTKGLLKKGAKVKKGDMLGLLGNAGGSSEPHVHVQALDDPDGDGDGETVPLNFSNIYIIDKNVLKEPDPNASWKMVIKQGLPFQSGRRCMIWPSAKKPCWYPSGKSEIAKHGIAESKYQEEFTKMWNCGYYPEWVDGYDVAGKAYFNMIFRYNSNNYSIAAKHNMTKQIYLQQYNLWVAQKGYRLQQLDNYLDQGQLKFAAIFIKKPGLPNSQPAYNGATPQQHQKFFDTFTGQGYVPVNVSVTSVGGKLYYSAFYEKRNVGGYALKSFLSQQEYQDMYDDMSKKKWEQVYINAYHHNGQTRFSVIWYQNSGFSFNSATRKSSSDNYQDKWEANAGKGLLTRCVTGYDEGGKHWFAAHWAK